MTKPDNKESRQEDVQRYRSPRKKRGRGGKKGMQPPLTPMIDVTFQLLLFFLLTMTFREAEGLIPGSLPAGNSAPAASSPAPTIYLRVRSAGGTGGALSPIYEFKGENVSIQEAQTLYQTLVAKKEVAGTAETPVIIEPGGNVPWEFVVDAFNQAVRAKFEKIGFATRM